MFQTFDTLADPTLGAPRLARLRQEMARLGLTGFLVPRADEFQGEYVPPSAERLHWLTGFSGSAGIAVILADRATVLVDGRYTLQVRAEVDTAVFTPDDGVATPVHAWLAANLAPGDRLGFDPWLHTRTQVRRLIGATTEAHAELVAVSANLVDHIWTDRPAPPHGPFTEQPLPLAGEAVATKIARLATSLAGADCALLTQPDSIAWAFNIRGCDIARNPVPLAFALLPAEGRPTLFVAPEKLGAAVRAHLAPHVDLAGPDELLEALDRLGTRGARVRIDPAWTPEILVGRLEAAGATLVEGEDPVILPKALKNVAEIEGTRAAHLRDAAAMAKFLAWFDAEGHATDEITCCERLEAFRAEGGALLDLSFDTISGAGPNGAIVHYHATRATNRPVEHDSLFLLDSGGQYRDGTTDVTRTLAVGRPSDEMRRAFTLVLKGHIAIAAARFPVGTTGATLDGFARLALWKAGLDYDHGTGHGVGSYLSVHEGPQRIAKTGTVPLQPGMIVSNEPGYYATGRFGIRIENLVLVTPAEHIAGGERPMLGFETLTLVPIDTRAVDASLMTAEEIAWLDAYHARVRAAVAPLVDQNTHAWLERATAPLGN
jgi:Xaa-Pro aminopeptidase